jgi:hypothetical protein
MGREADPCICQEDVMAFGDLVVEYARDMKCFPTREALAIAFCLKQGRQHKSIKLPRFIGFDGLADNLRSQSLTQPEPS